MHQCIVNDIRFIHAAGPNYLLVFQKKIRREWTELDNLLNLYLQVFEGDSEAEEVATIVKHWGGCREMFGAANDFSVRRKHFKVFLH